MPAMRFRIVSNRKFTSRSLEIERTAKASLVAPVYIPLFWLLTISNAPIHLNSFSRRPAEQYWRMTQDLPPQLYRSGLIEAQPSFFYEKFLSKPTYSTLPNNAPVETALKLTPSRTNLRAMAARPQDHGGAISYVNDWSEYKKCIPQPVQEFRLYWNQRSKDFHSQSRQNEPKPKFSASFMYRLGTRTYLVPAG
ncbi:hypothetical protein BT96DRAFT_1017355 [Gymnopus androsaceus JB14]|uniref:Uncharacterized protein n=1 Tax=Gymnopus androsaceus JB14 TaxID=1447944 RepID=A0A6A4HWU5_9AGAR|nr:hypothetical protein BT96DRAFT_1017355 [Gymnopus androsaceus JB14]